MELKDLKLINNGGIPELEQPSLSEKMSPIGMALGTTTGKSTLADRKAILNLPKFVGGKYADDPNATTDTGERTGLQAVTSMVMQNSGTTPSTGNIAQDFSNSLKSAGSTADPGKQLGSVGSSWKPGSSGGGGGSKTPSKFLSTLGSIGGAVGNNLAGAIDFAGSIAGAGLYNTTANDLLQDAGTSSGNIGGVGYTRLNDVDSAQISAQTSAENSANTVGLMGKGASIGASIGSVVGPVGGLIGGAVGAIGGLVGGLLGGAARKRKMRRMIAEAKDKAFRQNDYARSGALTSAMQQQYAQEFGDTESQSLYGFAEGLAQTPFGFASGKLTNAYGSNGEFAVQRDPLGNVIAVTKLGHGRDNKDTVPIVVDDKTEIYTNKKVEIAPGIKVRPSEYFENTGDANGANYMTAMNIQKNKGYKCGKLPKFDNGKWGVPEWSNFLGNMVPLIATGAEYFKNQAQPIGSYTATHSNPYASRGMQLMSQRQYNPYQAYNDMWNTYAKNSYGISNNGNLSSSQQALLRSTDYAGTLDRIAKLNEYAQDINNKYRADEAGYLLSEGRFGAEINQRDDMKRYDTHVASHGAKDLRGNTLLAQAGNLWLNMFKGFSDLDYYNYMKHMFDDDRRQEAEDRKTKNKIVVENPKKTATTKRKSMYPYKLPEVSKSIVYKNKPVVGADINPVIGNWNRFMNDSPQFVYPFITSLFK